MFVLLDTFNNRRISRHRTLENAIRAREKHLAAVKRANGRDAFLTYDITHADGRKIAWDVLHRAEETHYMWKHGR